jgi:hypothetical protein
MDRIVIPNGMQNHHYEFSFKDVISEGEIELIDLDTIQGLQFDKNEYLLKGVPELFGSFSFTIQSVFGPLEVDLYINQDPKTMWKDIPSKQDIKADNESITCFLADRYVIAASRRGNSHAHTGEPRDDHFIVKEQKGWIIGIVADGAGSASLSHIGSKIACEALSEDLNKSLSNQTEAFEALIEQKDERLLKSFLYDLYGKSLIHALKELKNTAEKQNVNLRDLHTTVLITLSKRFNDYTFNSAFQIGDGITAVYSELNNKLTVLGDPDIGDYAGQTNFITSDKILRSAKDLMNRIKIDYSSNDTLIFSMTDGITDPYFPSVSSHYKLENWELLWNDLSPILNLGKSSNNNQKGNALLNWLNFYKPSYHDDRTMLIIL